MSELKRNTWVFYITQFLRALIFTAPIWVIYYQGRISPAEISYLVTIQYASQMLLELPSGALADMIGRKNTNLVGYLVGASGFLIFPLAQSFWQFAFLAFLMGLMDSFISGSEEALIYDTYKQAQHESKIEQVFAKSGITFQIGLIIATMLGGFMYQYWVFLPYVMYGLSLMLGAIFISFYREPSIDSESFSVSSYLNQIKIGSKEIFKDQYIKVLSLFYITVAGITWSSMLYFNNYLLTELIDLDSLRGLILSSIRLINILLVTLFLKNSKLFTYKRKILLFPIIMIVAYLPGLAFNGVLGVIAVQALMLVSTARWILLAPLTNQVFSSKYRATAISSLSLMIGVVYVFLTLISAPIITHLGIKAMFSLLGIFSLVGLTPLTVWLLKTKRNTKLTTMR